MLSENIYHRVYQLVKRNVDLRVIAATLNLSLHSVLNVIARIEKNELEEKKGPETLSETPTQQQQQFSLDSYLVPLNRYAILQFTGFLVKDTKEKIEADLLAVKLSTWKIIAIQLTEVSDMDETGARLLLDFIAEMKSHDRYIALLDPSMELEVGLTKYHFEDNVSIFGTKWAFEADALSSKNSPTAYHPKSRSQR